MSERADKYSAEADRLIDEGSRLVISMRYDCQKVEFRRLYMAQLKADAKQFDNFVKNLPSFKDEYQGWYTKAQALIKHVMPDRLSDFLSYFEIPKGRKDVNVQNYMIRDYLQGLMYSRNGEVIADGSAAIPDFEQQVNMVKAARSALDSTIMNLRSLLQADLFDSELETAHALAKAGYSRAAGAICGVVIEKHLHQICDDHSISIRKKHPSIADLNQALRDADITTIPQWRFVQHLADIRNICDHAKGREPTDEEIKDLTFGTEKIIKTIF